MERGDYRIRQIAEDGSVRYLCIPSTCIVADIFQSRQLHRCFESRWKRQGLPARIETDERYVENSEAVSLCPSWRQYNIPVDRSSRWGPVLHAVQKSRLHSSTLANNLTKGIYTAQHHSCSIFDSIAICCFIALEYQSFPYDLHHQAFSEHRRIYG